MTTATLLSQVICLLLMLRYLKRKHCSRSSSPRLTGARYCPSFKKQSPL